MSPKTQSDAMTPGALADGRLSMSFVQTGIQMNPPSVYSTGAASVNYTDSPGSSH